MTATALEVRDGDALSCLRDMRDASVQACITSPPYFGLRDYSTGQWEDGDPSCAHTRETRHQAQGTTSTRVGRTNVESQRNETFRSECGRCGARRVDLQLGLEETVEEYVARLVDVLREVRRVLRDDGVLWLVIGDSYSQGPTGRRDHGVKGSGSRLGPTGAGIPGGTEIPATGNRRVPGFAPKNLLGVPWRVAFALQDDGWILRAETIWAKSNPLPESVTDRPTRAHEQVFLFAKRPRYFYDAVAIREPDSGHGAGNGFAGRQDHRLSGGLAVGGTVEAWQPGGGRNKRSVWTIPTRPYKEAHHAVFPPALVEPMMLAGTSPTACGECGAPWRRVIEPGGPAPEPNRDPAKRLDPGQAGNVGAGGIGFRASRLSEQEMNAWRATHPDRTTGWEPTCAHTDPSGRCVVLDPFAGSGTTGVVCGQLGRDFLGIELNAEYAALARRRLAMEGRPGSRRHDPPRVGDGQIGLLDEDVEREGRAS